MSIRELLKVSSVLCKKIVFIQNGRTTRAVCSESKAIFKPGVSYTSRTHMCGDLTPIDVSKRVKISGWLQYQRLGGKFLVLRDACGAVQVAVFDAKIAAKVSKLPLESVIRVTGVVKQRPNGQINQDMKTGHIEVVAEDVEILNQCNTPLPFNIQDFHQVKESLRLQYRYLDLRHDQIQRNLQLRSTIIFKMREFLCKHNGFIDVETPTLFRKTPGGAREFVVPTHSAGNYYSLPQSPQQFKQLLMVGGLDRYMQIARCYRDESAKPDRQPEFTQVDIEMSFITQEDIKRLIEGLLSYSWPDHLSALTLPFLRLDYNDAIRLYGSDKPDTRFDAKLQDITDLVNDDLDLGPFDDVFTQQQSPTFQAIRFSSASEHLSSKDIDNIRETLKSAYSHQYPLYEVVRVMENGKWLGSHDHEFNASTIHVINQRLSAENGDLLFLSAGEYTQTCLLLGKLRTITADVLKRNGMNIYGSENQMNFLWVENFPLFLPKEDSSGLESAHHPFTAPHPEDSELIYTEPHRVRSQHYDLVLNGSEVGGGSIRIHNSQTQRYVLTDILKEDTSSLEHLIQALDYGCPPHGGIALGVDRLISIICGASSIRDVIAFPKSSEGRCLMSNAPAPVTREDIEYYHLKERPETRKIDDKSDKN